MKKPFLLLLFFLFVTVYSLHAQLQKGNVLVGADIANFNVYLNSGSNFNILVNPKAAWFIENDLALGGYITIGANGAKGIEPTTTFGIGALGRYYVNDPNVSLMKHMRLFGEANVGIESTGNAEANTSTTGLGFGFGPGLSYFITPNIGLEGLLKYNGLVGFGSEAYTNYLNLNIGFQIYLPTAKLKAAAMNKQ
jgi:hypothetical protein